MSTFSRSKSTDSHPDVLSAGRKRTRSSSFLDSRSNYFDTGPRKLVRAADPSRLPLDKLERWSLHAGAWTDYTAAEQRRWREWFFWAINPGGELWDAQAGKADLSGAHLAGADLSELDLRNTILSRAELSGCDLSRADLRGVDLTGAKLDHANLNRTRLAGADLSRALLSHANFAAADLSESTLHGVDLTAVDFKDASLFGTRLTSPVWWIELPRPTMDGRTVFQPGLPEHPVQDVRGLPPLLRRRLGDVQYLRDLYRKSGRAGRAVMWVWGVTSLYGQSVARWATFSLSLVALFAVLMMLVPTAQWAHHVEDGKIVQVVGAADFGRALWLSISTLCTLGLGDIVPVSGLGRLITGAEVVTGYILLGGLLSIFSNKLARLS